MSRIVIRLLLVEDDQVDRLACRRALDTHPDYAFELIDAETGSEGVRRTLDRHPDLILLDYELPDLDGLEFLDELQRDGEEMAVPVVMLTGAHNLGLAVEAMRRGARDYLVKDSDRRYLTLLPAVIERVLREQRLRADKRAAETKFRTLVEQIPAITYMADLDVPGRLLYISPQVRQLGFTPEERLAVGAGLLDLIHPDDRSAVQDAYAASSAGGKPLRSEYRITTRDGETRWLLDEARIVHDARGTPLFLQGVLIDITDDKQREEELRRHRQHLEEMVAERTAQLERQAALLKSANACLLKEIEERRLAEQAARATETRFRLLLESAGEGIYGLDAEGSCIFINNAALDMLQFTRDELLGRATHPYLHHSRRDGTPYPAEECPIYDAFRSGVAQRGMIEALWRKNDSMMIAEYSSYPLRENDEVSGAVLVFRDVTESQALADRLAWQASHDALTGLVNREEFERRLGHALDSGRRDKCFHALCYLDLDQFKVVNDTCGHAAGDELLRQVSALLHRCVRQRDTLARLGGDEFGILLEHCPADQAVSLALELRDAVRDFRFNWQGRIFAIGASIGIAPLTASEDTVAAAMCAADAACYIAKEQGRNRVHLYRADDADLIEHRSKMLWVPRLTEALDQDRFKLYYQSIVPLGSATPRPHYEVLLRLQGPDGQLVEPMAFLPTAERYDLMPAIDRWVLREVIRCVATGQHAAEPRPLLSVNLSGRSLADDHLAEYLRGLLTEYGVPGDVLCLEISEAAASANIGQASRKVAEFKELGCRISLSRFGGGMSSFIDFRALPIDFIKMDGGLIRSLAEDPVSRAVAEGINRIAHVLSIQTVAECTETDLAVSILKDLGIDHAQGYVLAEPVPIERLATLGPV